MVDPGAAAILTALVVAVDYRVEENAILIVIDSLLVIHESGGVVVREAEEHTLAVSRDDVAQILRVQFPQFLDRNADNLGNLLEVQVLVDHEGVHVSRHGRLVRNYVVVLVVLEHIERSHEGWHIAPGFFRKVRVDRPEILGSGSPYGLGNVSCTAVVG